MAHEAFSDGARDAAIGRNVRIALDHRVQNLDGAAHRVDHATKLNNSPVVGALHYASMVDGDRGVDQIASARSRAKVRSSSAPASRLNPTTSAANIAASFRVSVTGLLSQNGLNQTGPILVV